MPGAGAGTPGSGTVAPGAAGRSTPDAPAPSPYPGPAGPPSRTSGQVTWGGAGRTDASKPAGNAAPSSGPTVNPAAAKVVRLAGTFGVLVVASVLVATLPLPWRVASIGFAVLAVVWGVRAWVLAIRSRVRAGLPVMLGIGVVVACGWVLVGLVWLSLWDAQTAQQACVSKALTVSARQECAQQFQQDVQRRTEQMRRTGLTTP
jgi:hypothetical protein